MSNASAIALCGKCSSRDVGTLIFPIEGLECGWPNGVRGVVYFFILLYLFLGVGIASDTFMNAIEAITSSTRTIRNKDGTTRNVLIWNGTVANLSLMALGSSAPEILLSVVELLVDNLKAGELGPNTIVGSGAFNLLMISAVCIMGMPAGETRLIKDRQIFSLTATFSIFAYVWLALIVSFISPGYITIAEAVITFLGFPALIGGAYAVDKGLFRKHKVMPSSPAAAAEATPPGASDSSSDGHADDTPTGTPPTDAPPTNAPLTGASSQPQGGGGVLDRLKRKTKEIMEDMDASFNDKKNGEGAEVKAKSTTMIVARWGLSAGALNEAQFREMQLKHLQKT